MRIDALLARLAGVRKRSPDSWSAQCPAHEDRSPSLSVRETSDGRILLKCFAGCDVVDVVAAIGLELTDLFPPRPDAPGGGAMRLKRRRLLSAEQALEILSFESLLVWTAAQNLAAGHSLTEGDLDRLTAAVNRIDTVRVEVRS